MSSGPAGIFPRCVDGMPKAWCCGPFHKQKDPVPKECRDAIASLPALVLAGANRDIAGKPIEDAHVTATSRDGLAMVTRSNAAGVYNLPDSTSGSMRTR
jgi:hypothetical protein